MKRLGYFIWDFIYVEVDTAHQPWLQRWRHHIVDFLYVEAAVHATPKPYKSHSLRTRMYVHRLAYLLLTFSACGLVYGGAYWLYQENLTNPKTIENFFIAYKDSYDYNRYTGQSKLTAVENAALSRQTSATPVTDYAKSVPVLMYHRIATDKDRYNVTPAAFKAQMFALKKAGYTTISADDYANFINGTKKLPAKSILITFDDGTKDSYYGADPVLKALGFRATSFIITKYSLENPNGSHYYLSAIELKAMERTGRWDLEAHARDGHSYYQIAANGQKGEYYPNKLYLPATHRMETDTEYAARVYNDMRIAKQELGNFTHKPEDLFAFPFADMGEHNSSNYHDAPTILAKAAQKLFKNTMMLYYPGRDESQGYYNSKQALTYRIQMELGKWTNGQSLISFIKTGAAKPLPYTDGLQVDNGWRAAWGADSVYNGTLTISGTKDSTGAGILLDGASAWSNYTLSAQATLAQGTSYGLIARMQNDYRTGCYFGQGYVSIRHNKGTTAETIAEKDTSGLIVLGHTVQAGVRVTGDQIACMVNGRVVLQTTDATMPSTGGIGFSVWDSNKPSRLDLRNIKVTTSAK